MAEDGFYLMIFLLPACASRVLGYTTNARSQKNADWVLGPQTCEFGAWLEHAHNVPGRPFTSEADTDPVPHDFLQVVCELQVFMSFAVCLNYANL